MRIEEGRVAKIPEAAFSRLNVTRIAESDAQSRAMAPPKNCGCSWAIRTKKLFDILGLGPPMNRHEVWLNSLRSIPKRASSSRLRNLIELFETVDIVVNSIWSIPIFSK